ncbi:urease accessory protein UreE [Vannielia sp.]|uniref:urease accessory protein UreE n=1 Tax=Vannielia sp. TaxID=2813045 RepID=UPI00260E166C|nr:urease accessory protein UreE [Vannielia sp.]MDF1872197.1 urease accessory protein UreE [Vannielia sp.]
MPPLLTAQSIRSGQADKAQERIRLSYEARFLRRKVLTTESGTRVMIDLPQTTSLEAGDALECGDGRLIAIEAAVEPLLEVRGAALPQLSWHIGNRHTPCQIEPHRLLIQRDHVLLDMLTRLGAQLAEVDEPFTPEGGAYGHGRTHGHDHSASHGPDEPTAHSHGKHTHNHGH